MPGGLIQLASSGVQDFILTGQPQMTFYKRVYRKYTNFAIEDIDIKFSGDIEFNKEVNCIIKNNGDLLGNCMLEVKIPEISGIDIEKDIKIEDQYNNFQYDEAQFIKSLNEIRQILTGEFFQNKLFIMILMKNLIK